MRSSAIPISRVLLLGSTDTTGDTSRDDDAKMVVRKKEKEVKRGGETTDMDIFVFIDFKM